MAPVLEEDAAPLDHLRAESFADAPALQDAAALGRPDVPEEEGVRSPRPGQLRYNKWIMSWRSAGGDRDYRAEPMTRQQSRKLAWERRLDASGKKQPGSGYAEANCISRVFFWWINPLVDLAAAKSLELNNVWPMPNDNMSGPLLDQMDDEWSAERVRVGPGEKRSLFRALLRIFKWRLVVTGILQGFQQVFMLLVPLLVQQLLNWKQDHQLDSGTPLTRGVVLALLLFLAGVIGQGLVANHQILMMYMVGMDARTALNAMVYRKSMRLSNRARQSTSTGECVTLMSNDAQRLPDAALFFHNLWSTPIFIIIAVFLLVRTIGVAAVGGLAFLVLVMPLQAAIAMRQMRIQRGQMARTDARLKLVNEVLQGIKIVKYYAWEASFQERLEKLRALELVEIKKFAFTNAYSMCLLLGTPSVMVMLTLVIFYTTGGDFSPSNVFTAVSLLLVIRFPLFMLPMTIASALQAKVSLGRLQRFLDLEEISEEDRSWTHRLGVGADGAGGDGSGAVDDSRKKSDKPRSGGSIHLDGAVFEWSRRDESAAAAAIAGAKGAAAEKKAVAATAAAAAGTDRAAPATKRGLFGYRPRGAAVGNDEDKTARGDISAADGRIATAAVLAVSDLDAMASGADMPSAVPWKLHVDELSVEPGELLAVVGAVGSGKSSLVSSILGDMTRIAGSVRVDGSIAYVAQTAWIVNATLRENILMGRRFDAARYKKVVRACELKADLEILPAGDSTEIGEKGINLSGGQKQRVSLARAAYADADVYMFDDPLSAVDAQVARHIFEECIVGLLGGKTRLFCANQLQFLATCDRVVVLSGGGIAEMGTFNALLAREGALSQLMETFGHDDDDDEEEAGEAGADGGGGAGAAFAVGGDVLDSPRGGSLAGSAHGGGGKTLGGLLALGPGGGKEEAKDPTERSVRFDTKANKVMRQRSRSRSASEAKPSPRLAGAGPAPEVVGTRLVQDEGKEQGVVNGAVYRTYFKDGSGGWALPIWLVFVTLLTQGTSNIFEYWVSIWTNTDYTHGGSANWYMYVYICLGTFMIVLYMVRGISFAIQSVRTSGFLHSHLLQGVLHAPMAFFDTTPIGRVLNRFSKDMDAIDLLLPRNIPMFVMTLATLVGVMVTISVVLPLFVIPLVPLMGIYYLVQAYYRPVSRDLQRLESVSRSPIFAQFSETLAGVTTLRAYNLQQEFIDRNAKRLDDSNRSFFHLQVCNRWLQLRLELLGGLLILCAALLIVFWGIDAGLAGLVLTYTQQITGNLTWALRMGCETEARITSAERLKEYGDLTPEAALVNPDYRPPAGWPAGGAISLKGISMRYREGLELVLRDVSIDVRAGERVGIAGRTGSGKSSLMVVLFRIVEPCAGSMSIDGVDALRLGLRDLRRAVSIIPQDPVMFCGTLRQNLDPFGRYDDVALWETLRAAHLYEFVSGLEGKLDAEIAEGGENLSLGQRQLVCLARAIVRRNKILVMDEATANVDIDTDMLIQATIRREFVGCTILTIAHRLNTIMDSDRILIMSKGVVAEFDTPANLVSNPNSALMSFISETGSGSSRRLMETAMSSSAGAGIGGGGVGVFPGRYGAE